MEVKIHMYKGVEGKEVDKKFLGIFTGLLASLQQHYVIDDTTG